MTAMDGQQKLFLEVTTVESHRTILKVVDQTEARAPATKLVLFPFLLKGRKLDDVVRQACESGVSTIVPVVGDHCVARADAEEGVAKAYRWSAIAREAAQQSGNPQVCDVRPPVLSRELPDLWTEDGPLLAFHQTPLDNGSLHRYLSPRPKAVGLIIGPEGGLSSPELEVLLHRGAKPVWLGPFVLRAETASLYALAAVNTILQESLEWTIPL